MEKEHRSLSFRISLYISLAAFLYTLAASTLQIWNSYRGEIEEIEADLLYIDKSYRSFITNSLFNYDLDQLHLEIQGILEIPYMEYVEVIDKSLSEEQRYSRGNPDLSRDRQLRTPLLYQRGDEHFDLGELIVSVSYSSLIENIRNEAGFILGLNIATIILLAATSIVLMRISISTKLTVMADFTRSIDLNTLDKTLKIRKRANRGEQDELDYVAQAINTLIERLREDIHQRKLVEEDLREMIYIASHDLQVPIVSIEAYASELLEDFSESLHGDGEYCLKRLKTNAVRMHTLVLSLLDLSRLNTKSFPDEWIDTGKMTENILKDLQISFEKSGASFHINGHLADIYGDRVRIEGVFRNIIVNALKFASTKISLSYTPERKTFVFCDNGIGIPEDQLEKIFKPGERLKQIDNEGAGMGLTFCKKVISKHGGDIYAESSGEKRGSCFTIVLPKKRLREKTAFKEENKNE